MNATDSPVLYAIVTGSPVAGDVGVLVDLAQADGWEVCVIASPDGRRFIDADALAAKTGYPVRSQYKEPDEADALPPATGMIVAPITSNSLAKWAAGISDTLPLGLLVEAVGWGKPVVGVPYINRALYSFPPVEEAMRKLAEWGVSMVAEHVPHEPRSGGAREQFPWAKAWQTLLEHPRLSLDD
ncbi:flavoprotein [Nocardia sp. CDC159]|uniref:Flavoprotein n=1 Tax=Nocardia pulmonis TaxID=2951408 RepID=A0A9X2EBW1_9NOCA|nr:MULTISPECIES: flavoprotein [Nocardia]MCM6778002.1 flavoprotein [Nocardia pulmonis]MCM6790827.1 flavoprotein [Nocardia sp. CDC159]